MDSPLIEEVVWGTITVRNFGTFRDAKVFPGAAKAWDWNDTGTRHVPGIQVADVEELIAAGSKTIVLSRGMHLVLQTQPETIDWLQSRDITTIVEETTKAVETYNRLAKAGEPVGGLIHSTC